MADDGPTTTQRVLRLLLAIAGAAVAGFLWLVVGSAPASADGLGDPLVPVVDAVEDAVEPVVEPVVAPVRQAATPATEPIDAVLDPVVDPVVDAVEDTAGTIGVEVPPVPPLPVVDPDAPLVPVLPELPAVDELPGALPDPVAPTPTDEAPAGGGTAAARAATGPAVPAAGSLDRIGRAEGGAITAFAPPSVHHRNAAGSAAGSTGSPAPPVTPPTLAPSTGTGSSSGSSRGDPAQLAVLLTVAALALGSGRRVSWPPVDWRPVGFASLIERPG